MNWTENVRQDLVRFELVTLSKLLSLWAKPDVVRRRRDKWEDKLPYFRKGVMAGLRTGAKEAGPPSELVRGEYAVTMVAVEQLRGECPRYRFAERLAWLRDRRVTYRIGNVAGREITFVRPCPVPERVARKLRRPKGEEDARYKVMEAKQLDWSRSAEALCRDIVEARLRISPDKIDTAVGRRRKRKPRIDASDAQELLASMFLDLCSDPQGPGRATMLAMVLDSLLLSRYHILMLTYLVQTAHSVTNDRLYLGEYDETQVRALCRAVSGRRRGPFARLLSG